jgi:hypothetical protein
MDWLPSARLELSELTANFASMFELEAMPEAAALISLDDRELMDAMGAASRAESAAIARRLAVVDRPATVVHRPVGGGGRGDLGEHPCA